MKNIAYCIPNMDRDQDIKNTLESNLNSIKNSKFSTLHLIDFNDSNSNIIKWAQQRFQHFILDKKLFLYQEPRLKYWHFSIAKNKFKKYIRSTYYSSLDGDNYISKEEVLDTEDIINSSSHPVFIHHFSGKWGDGTCGRITLPTKIYKSIGYQENIFPRQFDEISLIIKTLFYHTNIPFYCVDNGIFIQSEYLNQYISKNNIKINIKPYVLKQKQSPLNKKIENYIDHDIILNAYSNINRIICLYPISNNEYKKVLDYQFNKILDKLQANNLYNNILPYVFDNFTKPSTIHSIKFLKPFIIVNEKIKIKPVVGNFDIDGCKKLWQGLLV